MKSAVVLLSGGLDSTTTLAIAKDMGFEPLALTILYGQRNQVEIISAKMVALHLGIKQHKIFDINLRLFGGSALTDDISVGKHDAGKANEIPNTYVPARNTILLSLALAYAEVNGACDIFFGANVHDYSGYPDCRPAYVDAFQKMANLAVKSAVLGQHIRIHAPLVNLSKAEIIKKGISLDVPYDLTHSCYDPKNDRACGACSACFYRRKGFLDAGVDDPTKYV